MAGACVVTLAQEAANIARVRVLLADMVDAQDVVVPQVRAEWSSGRVLTMSFEEGFPCTDVAAMRASGLRPAAVAQLLSLAFCEQTYRHGFVHCDPHEANVLVRAHPRAGRPQLVLLDHGLYRALDDGFRANYCRLWSGIIRGDRAEIELRCRAMNAGDAFPLLAAVLTMRPWNDIVTQDVAGLGGRRSLGEQEVLKAYARRYFKQVVWLLGRLPSDMLLLLKTNDCLRHIDRALGVPVNTALQAGATAASVILAEDLRNASGLLDVARALWRYALLVGRVRGLGALWSFWTGLGRLWSPAQTRLGAEERATDEEGLAEGGAGAHRTRLALLS